MDIKPINQVPVVERIESYNRHVVESQPIQTSNDTVTLSPESLQFSKYVEVVKSLPEERTELVEKFKQELKQGCYPPPTIIDGVTRLIGQNIKSTVDRLNKT